MFIPQEHIGNTVQHLHQNSLDKTGNDQVGAVVFGHVVDQPAPQVLRPNVSLTDTCTAKNLSHIRSGYPSITPKDRGVYQKAFTELQKGASHQSQKTVAALLRATSLGHICCF